MARRGFTIVELLIVVVVIAILAAITIVSYVNVTKSASEASLKSELSDQAKQVGVYKVENDTLPGSLAVLRPTKRNTEAYFIRKDQNQYCMELSLPQDNAVRYHVTEEGQVRQGFCPATYYTSESCFGFNSSTRAIGAYYDFESNNSTNPACPRDVAIPPTIGGVAVQSIVAGFANKGLTSVALPDTITNIDTGAFSNNKLTSFVFPRGTVYAASNGLASNNSITVISIPYSVDPSGIGGYAFTNNPAFACNIPDTPSWRNQTTTTMFTDPARLPCSSINWY